MNLFDDDNCESGTEEISNFRLDEINVAKEIMADLLRPSPPLPMIYQEGFTPGNTDEDDEKHEHEHCIDSLYIRIPSPIKRETYDFLPWHHSTYESWAEYVMMHGNDGILHTRLGTFTTDSWNPDYLIKPLGTISN